MDIGYYVWPSSFPVLLRPAVKVMVCVIHYAVANYSSTPTTVA